MYIHTHTHYHYNPTEVLNTRVSTKRQLPMPTQHNKASAGGVPHSLTMKPLLPPHDILEIFFADHQGKGSLSAVNSTHKDIQTSPLRDS